MAVMAPKAMPKSEGKAATVETWQMSPGRLAYTAIGCACQGKGDAKWKTLLLEPAF